MKVYEKVLVHIHEIFISISDGSLWFAPRFGRFTSEEIAAGTRWTGR
jgi:hypothetical protein